MLPMAKRASSILSPVILPSAARQSLAMACALRVPTLREYAVVAREARLQGDGA